MTWIKICGTTNLEDALTAVDAGADALGFVFYENSPRNVDPETVRQIVAHLPDTVEKVGVFVSETLALCAAVAQSCGLTAVQLHAPANGRLSINSKPSCKLFLAVPASLLLDEQRRSDVLPKQREYIDAVFVDSGNAQQPGGTGTQFDWHRNADAIAGLSTMFKVVVAGGLTPGNVSAAIRILRPWGVDVVSGVEASPGKKDPQKVRAFINAVRQSERVV
jgi:phosphoribosylanthranilate isomerase